MQAGCDMLIIGGGPGGYAAALYAARSGLETLVLEKLSAGGQMALSEQIDNYPGFDEGIDGFSLGERMRRGAERFGARTLLAEVTGAALAGTNKTVITSAGAFTAKAVVIATGARPRNLGIPGESAFEGRGAHYCAACDGMASSCIAGIPCARRRSITNRSRGRAMWNSAGTARPRPFSETTSSPGFCSGTF